MWLARGNDGWAALWRVLVVVLCLGALPLAAPAAEPLKGVALIIGQSEYKSLTPLPNPVADAKAMEDLLARLGFETDIATDENTKKLHRTVDGFIDDAEGADVALLYYSGHAIEAGGVNYLIPVDADLGALDEAGKTLVSLQDILERLRGKARITILLLDACRSNPFPKDALVRREASDAGEPIVQSGLGAPRGAVAIEATASPDSIGEVIGFAAEPGHAALDGAAGTNSPYAAALLRHLGANAGYDFGQVMTMVTEEVFLATQARQRPWTNASLRSFLTFGGKADEASPDETLLTGERRKLLLAIAATPQDMRAAVEGLAKDQSLPLDPLYGMLKELQVDTSAGPDQLDKQIRAGAENLKKLLAERMLPVRKDPDLIRLSGLADRAQAEGLIALAKDYRAKASARADELDETLDEREAELQKERVELASTYADEGDTAVLAFDFRFAAAKYAKAHEQVAGRDDALAIEYMNSQANALANQGIYSGNKDDVRQSLQVFDEAIKLADKTGNHNKWAVAQNDLGRALRFLGEHESDSASLIKAAAAYEAALTVSTREQDAYQWAKTQNNLGNVLWSLGSREEGNEKLVQSIAAYEAALTVLAREQTPLDWALTQNNLGNARYKLAERDAGTESLAMAVAAYRAALTVQTSANKPRDWAMSQSNLGVALLLLGQREKNFNHMNDAVTALEAALTVRTRERMPLDWAATQNNLGNAFAALGKPKGDERLLARAITAYEAALQEITPERAPLQWARTQNNLGMVKLPLGILKKDKALMVSGRQAVEASWNAYKSAGYVQYEAIFRERLQMFDDFLREMN